MALTILFSANAQITTTNTNPSGPASSAIGYYTSATGYISTAMGRYTTASDWSSLTIGQYNSSGSSATSATSFSTSAPAFVIGNGTASDATSDAFKVMFNGDAYVSSSLYLGGTAITATAAEINLLDGLTTVAVSYTHLTLPTNREV